jgi:hypothetical protein
MVKSRDNSSQLLYHYSEEPGIRRFVPRPATDSPESTPVVWAIDEQHAMNYWLPRECPRVIYRNSPAVNADDLARFFSSSTADAVIAVESGWLERIRATSLYEYTFASTSFESKDRMAGYSISYEPVEPITVQPAGGLIARILACKDIELRFIPELHTIRDAILLSSVDHFSIIRFRNAAPRLNPTKEHYIDKKI